jgi:hypothetical protein
MDDLIYVFQPFNALDRETTPRKTIKLLGQQAIKGIDD